MKLHECTRKANNNVLRIFKLDIFEKYIIHICYNEMTSL